MANLVYQQAPLFSAKRACSDAASVEWALMTLEHTTHWRVYSRQGML